MPSRPDSPRTTAERFGLVRGGPYARADRQRDHQVADDVELGQRQTVHAVGVVGAASRGCAMRIATIDTAGSSPFERIKV
jgi:hypothetical protein